MTWEKLNEFTLTNQRYNITKPANPKPYPLPYTLWQLEPKRMIGCYPTAEDAKAALIGLNAESLTAIAPTTDMSKEASDD